MTKHSRRPEDIGAMGQSYFKQLAKDVGLVANESNDDKAGWDFEVEHPSPITVDYSSQSRPVYRIQVKSTEAEAPEVRISYSSLISLIQFSGPAFIFLARYKDQVSPVQAYLLHLDEAHARNALRSLRQKEVLAPGFKLNLAKITVKFDPGSCLTELSGKCLKQMFDAAVLDTYLNYVKTKADWLQKIEKESTSWHFNIRFENEDAVAAMANCFLGYEQPFNITSVKYKAPLGISGELPSHPEIFKPTIIKPIEENLKKAVVRLAHSEYAPKYAFSTVMYGVPRELSRKHAAMRFKAALFDIVIRLDKGIAFDSADLRTPGLRASIRELHGFMSYLKYSRDYGTTYMEVEPLDGGMPLKLSLETPSMAVEDNFDQIYEMFNAAYSTLARLGLADETIQPSLVFTQTAPFQMLQIIDAIYDPEYVLDFQSDNEPNESVNAVIFSSSIELETNTVVFHSAFFGRVERMDSKNLRGRFQRSELLGQLIIPRNADLGAIHKEQEERLRSGLRDRGFSIL